MKKVSNTVRRSERLQQKNKERRNESTLPQLHAETKRHNRLIEQDDTFIHLESRQIEYDANMDSASKSLSLSDRQLHQDRQDEVDNDIRCYDSNTSRLISTKPIVNNCGSNKSSRSSRSNVLDIYSSDIQSQNKTSTVKANSTASISRQKLEIKLQYARKKQERENAILKQKHENAILDIEEAIALASVNERNDDDDKISTIHSQVVKENVSKWVEQSNNIRQSEYDDERNDRNQFKRLQYSKEEDGRQRENQHQINNIEKWITRQSVPKDLPIFSGDPLEWPNFITQFENSTQICNLSNYENQIRLQKCLKGKAREIVQSLLILPSNINRVIQILRNRFGRPEYIVHLLLDQVRNFPIIKDDKIESLVDFFDVLTNLVFTLDNLNESDHIRNPILYQELLNKMSTNRRIDFVEYLNEKNSNEPPLIEFYCWLERKVTAASQLISYSRSPATYKDKTNNSKSLKSKTMTFTINDNKTIEVICSFCDKTGHYLSACDKFKGISVDERWKFITRNHYCFCCLRKYHSIKACKRRKVCSENCNKFHHPLLHKAESISVLPVCTDEVEDSIIHETNCHVMNTGQVMLKILPVQLKGPKGVIDTFALLDEGSTVSLIDSDMANDLGLEGPKRHLRIQWTNNQFNEDRDSQVVMVSIKGTKSDNFFTLRRVKTISGFALPSQTVNIGEICKRHPYLSQFKHLSYSNGQPTILIGQDNWPVIMSRRFKGKYWDGPVASETLLGWVIHGSVSHSDTNTQFTFLAHELKNGLKNENDSKDDFDILQDLMKQQWNFDISGTVSKDVSISSEDRRCVKIMNNTIKRVNERFEAGLLWKSDKLNLPESKSNACKRLKLLERKMDRNPVYANTYVEKFNDLLDKGYLKKLNNFEIDINNSKTWYLPHFGVINPNKPNKLRIVFDAAAKSHGYNLNDFLLSGPDLYNSLPNILMNFRINKIAFIGDIKEMFLQILVRKEDRYAQRLLWRGTDRNREPDVYELQVVFFGATCSPCIAQEVKNRNAREYRIEYSNACDEIEFNHYMDDYLGGTDTIESAITLIKEVSYVHSKAGFQICNWITNSPEVLNSINQNLRAPPKNEFNLNESNSEERILGIWWNYEEDIFVYRLKFHKINSEILNYNRYPTKRDILKIVMSIFDPLGFLSNFIIIGKILMQNIWESGIDWDDPITDNQYKIWKDWSMNFKNLLNFKIPRLLTTMQLTDTEIQLHIFCDASACAYSTVAYLRFQNQFRIECTLINSKARVAPLKTPSIPRLELMAALLGARLCHNLKQSLKLKINTTFIWSDSKTVLYWVKSSSRRFKTFVAQRLGEIQELTDPSWWKYVPSKINIADDATKIKSYDFSEKSNWLNGPEFLHKLKTEWPQGNFELHNFDEELIELKSDEFVFNIRDIRNFIVPDITRFSKWNRFIRTTAWVIKFVEKLNLKVNKILPVSNSYELQPENISKAELLLFKKVQLDSYSMEIACLQNNQSFKTTSSLRSIPCQLDENGLIRIKGRLNNADVKNDVKFPILLDSKHDITKLMVRHFHEKNNHIGIETVITELRQRFWIVNIRSCVKKSSYECQFCRIRKAKPQPPIIGQLPKCRVEQTLRPFIKTGVDYFGPIEVLVNRKHEKRWGVIFTCMTIRAVHLEIAQDLSSNAFIHVFRQFTSRKGFPTELYSDNGSNFRKANKDLEEAFNSWNNDEIIQFMTMKKCKWFFNPPAAPHMGGAWERLIQSIKKHLYFVLKEKYPKEYVLRTLFCEIENIINSRPITYNSSDADDYIPLTPNDILIGPNVNNLPLTKTTDKDLIMVSMWKSSQRLADIFWRRWISEYLPKILLSNKWSKDSRNVSVGDLVLIVDANLPRNCWPMGKILEVYPAKDGRIRIVDVKTNSGIFRRPVVKIIKLDILNECNSSE